MRALLSLLVFLCACITCILSCNDCCRPRDCQDIKELKIRPSMLSGEYIIYPEGTNGIRVRCDMSTDGGGWTVIQRRYSSYNFYRNWFSYQVGFGSPNGNHWLGNHKIYHITRGGYYQLRVDMRYSGVAKYAKYAIFQLGGPETDYTLYVTGYSGTAGDSLTYHSGAKFSTYDRDNDSHSSNCASTYSGAWWYKSCHKSNLNGLYGSTTYGKGLNWHTLTGYTNSVTRSEMKVRRIQP